jgi:hypothetical protein
MDLRRHQSELLGPSATSPRLESRSARHVRQDNSGCAKVPTFGVQQERLRRRNTTVSNETETLVLGRYVSGLVVVISGYTPAQDGLQPAAIGALDYDQVGKTTEPAFEASHRNLAPAGRESLDEPVHTVSAHAYSGYTG